MIKQEIENLIRETVEKIREKRGWKELDFNEINFKIEHSEQEEHGDYASNAALILSNQMSGDPMEIAKSLESEITKRESEFIRKVEVAKPGFINFFLKDSYFQEQVDRILEEGSEFGKSSGKNKKVVLEYGQPNTHKLPHVGHFRSYVLGESLARLLEFSGYEVFRANYQGDVGLHVAKCLWGYKEKDFEERGSLRENVDNLQKAYVYGSKEYEEDDKSKEEIKELNNKIQSKDARIKTLWEKTRQWSVDYYEKLHEKLNISYDRLYFESEAGEKGKQIVTEHRGDVFKKSQGAIIFPGSDYDLHDRVFITSEGNPTYEAKDLALPFLKKEDFDYDLSIISTASEQIDYFKVVYKALEQINYDLAKSFVHVPFGMISLKGGKLSSREGNIVSIDELLSQVENSLVSLVEEKEGNPNEEVISELVIGAAKYSILRNTPIKDMVFDVKESVDLEGNSGPYLQYTNVRILSILEKEAATENYKTDLLKEKEELSLLKRLSHFPEVVQKAAESYKPNLICNYLFDLAQQFNVFYEEVPVLQAENEELKKTRLALIKAVNKILEKGLHLLGINAPHRM